jgi:cytochrome c oxidase subunit 2
MSRIVASAALLVASVFAGFASMQDERRVISIRAERFSFTPSEIALATGEEVELRITSDDTAHGFQIRGRDTNITIPKRGHGEATAVVRFDQAGRHVFECSRMCGAGHNFMRGELVVRGTPAGAAAP